MSPKKILQFFSLLLIITEISLVEGRFVDLSFNIIKLRKKQNTIQKHISSMGKLFQYKLDENELYDDDILAVLFLAYELIRKRNMFIGPDVYWYSRKG